QVLKACGKIAVPAAEREFLAASLTPLLRDNKMPVEARAAVAEALAAQWCAPAAEALRGAARDAAAPALVRCAAIAGLGKHATLLDASTAVLFQAQADADEEVRAAASAALAQARTKLAILDFYGIGGNARAALAGAAEVVAVNAQRQQEMLEMLEGEGDAGRGAARPSAGEAVAPLLAKLKSADALERAAAAYDLGVLEAESAIAPLLGMLSDADARARRAAAAALARIAAKAGKDKIDAQPIITLLQHDDLLVRENAALLLADLQPAPALPALCQALGKEQSNRCLKAMAKALAHFQDRAAAEALAAAAERAPAEAAAACVRALGAQGKIAAPFLVRLLVLNKPALRQACREALKEMSGEDFGEDIAKWRNWAEGT
ncbi:MAG: hypothetical protein N3A66_03390, partial [Planctomycetota bacterium]|nr:hypothetical protein [Planctomycetota bacterium]